MVRKLFSIAVLLIAVSNYVIGQAPTNDNCSSAISLTFNQCSKTTYSGSTQNATIQAGVEPADANITCNGYNNNSVWYTFTTPASLTTDYVFDIYTSTFDRTTNAALTDGLQFTVIKRVDGLSACSNTTNTSWSSIACEYGDDRNHTIFNLSTSLLSPNTTYYVYIDNFSGGKYNTFTLDTYLAAPAPTVAPVTVCSGSSATLTPVGQGGATFNWYYSNSIYSSVLQTSSTYTDSYALSTDTVWVTQVLGGFCESPKVPAVINVNPKPATPSAVTATPSTVCPNTSTSITATSASGTILNWYDAYSAGNLLGSGSPFLYAPSASGSVYAAAVNSFGCESSRASVYISVTFVSTPTVSNVSVCPGTTATLTTFSSGTIKWYDAATGGNLVYTGSSFVTPVINTATSYWVTRIASGGTCESNRIKVDVTLKTVTAAPTVTNVQTCYGQTATLSPTLISGATVKWYSAATGGTSVSSSSTYTTTGLTTNVSYWVTQTSGTNCESNRAQIDVTVVNPSLPSASNVQICSGQTANLLASGSGTFKWYSAATGGTVLATSSNYTTPALTANVSYWVSQTISGCESSRLKVDVIVNSKPVVTLSTPTICSNTTSTISSTVSPSGSYTYQWTVPVGVNDPGNTSTFSTSVAGTYSLMVVDNTSSCGSSLVSSVLTVNNVPSVSLSLPSICQGQNANVTTLVTGSSNVNYTWVVPVGVTNPGSVPTFTTNVAGTYQVVATDIVTGCSSSLVSATLVVNTTPVLNGNDVNVCAGNLASVAVNASNGSGSYSYAWTVPSSFTNPGNVPSFSTSLSGSYSVIATDLNTTCQSLSKSINVVVNSLPIASVNSPVICSGISTNVVATSSSTNLSYSWTVPVGVANPGNTNSISTQVAGNYSVVVTDLVTNCSSSTSTGLVTVNQNPTVAISTPNTCANLNSIIVASPADLTTYNYYWTYPSGVSNPGNVTSFSTNVAGNYSLYIEDKNTLCKSSVQTSSLVVYPVPAVVISGGGNICAGDNVQVEITGTPSDQVTYNVNNSTVSVTLDNNGLYSFNSGSLLVNTSYQVVSATSANGCVSLQNSQTDVTISNPPTVSYQSSFNSCQGSSLAIPLNGSSNASVSYSIAGVQSTILLNSSGVGIINLSNMQNSTSVTILDAFYAASASCKTSYNSVISINVNNLPVISGGNAICQSATLVLTTQSQAASTNPWAVSDTQIATINNGILTGVSPGTTIVTFTDNNNCSITKTITINPNPTMVITANKLAICANDNSLFSIVNSSNLGMSPQYTWSLNGNSISNQATYSANQAGIYVLNVVNPSTTCSGNSNSITLVVNQNPVAQVSLLNANVCPGSSTTISATPQGNNYSYAWMFNGNTLTTTTNSFLVSNTGTYSVVVKDNNSGCFSNSVSTQLSNHVVPIASLPTTTAYCVGTSTNLKVNVSGSSSYSYNWSAPSGVQIPASNSSTILASKQGQYSVLVTDTQTSCSVQVQSQVSENPLPDATLTTNLINNITCVNKPYTVLINGSSNAYVTYRIDGIKSSAQLDALGNFSLIQSSTKSVVYMLDTIKNLSTGCVNAKSVSTTVTIENDPKIDVSLSSQIVCKGTPIILTNNVSTQTTEWYINNKKVNSPYTPTSSGLLDLKVKVTSAIGCTAEKTFLDTISVESLSAAFSFSTSELILASPSTTIFNNSVSSIQPVNYSWDFGDGQTLLTTDNSSFDHVFDVEKGMEFIVVLNADNGVCKSTSQKKITVKEDLLYYVPNAFTPNGDQLNNVFKPQFTSGFDPYDFVMRIYNRWGEVMFETHDSSIGWDGTYGGNLVQDGIYIYQIVFKLKDTEQKKEIQGNVNLMK